MNLNKFTGFSLLLFTAISLTFPNSARASDPVILETGKSTTFPTWEGSKNTQLCIIGMGGDTSVKINAGAQQESLSTADGQKTCIQRSWGGIIIGVTNQGEKLVKVWTS
jgi:hypothetical protein